MKNDTLAKFQNIISSIDSQSHEFTRQLEIYKCKIILIDGSTLRILEKYAKGELVYYSYYWLSSFNDLIMGWDCAPHHPAIDSFPHHQHIGSQQRVISSDIRNLNDSLAVIKKSLLLT